MDRFKPPESEKRPRPQQDEIDAYKRRRDMELEEYARRNENMKIINLTPHDVHVYDADGKQIIRTYPASGKVARVKSSTEITGEVDGILVARTTFGEIEGLPDSQSETFYIVSLLVLQAAAGKRDDLIGPDTGPGSVVRDENGQILGVRRFQVL